MADIIIAALVVVLLIPFFPIIGSMLGTFVVLVIVFTLLWLFYEYWLIWVGIIVALVIAKMFSTHKIKKEKELAENDIRSQYISASMDISKQKEEVDRQYAEASDNIRRQHEASEAELRRQHQASEEELRRQYAEAAEEIRRQQAAAEEELRRQHEEAANDIRRQHKEAEEDIKRQEEENKIKNGIIKAFETLELSPNSSFNEVRNKYHALCMFLHPDRYANTKNEQLAAGQMKLINAAYEVLKRYHFKMK